MLTRMRCNKPRKPCEFGTLEAAGVYGYGDSISRTEQPWSREISSQDNPNIRSSDAASQSIAIYDPAPVQEKTYNVENSYR